MAASSLTLTTHGELSKQQQLFINELIEPFLDFSNDTEVLKKQLTKITSAFAGTLTASDEELFLFQGVVQTPETHLRGIEKVDGLPMTIGQIQYYIFKFLKQTLYGLHKDLKDSKDMLSMELRILRILLTHPKRSVAYMPQAILSAVDNTLPGEYVLPNRCFSLTITTNEDCEWKEDLETSMQEYEENFIITCQATLKPQFGESKAETFIFPYTRTAAELAEASAEEKSARSLEAMGELTAIAKRESESRLRIWLANENQKRTETGVSSLTAAEVRLKQMQLENCELQKQKFIAPKLRAAARLGRFIHERICSEEIINYAAKQLSAQFTEILFRKGIQVSTVPDDSQRQFHYPLLSYSAYLNLLLEKQVQQSDFYNITLIQYKILTHAFSLQHIKTRKHFEFIKLLTIPEFRVINHDYYVEEILKKHLLFRRDIKDITDEQSKSVTFPAMINLLKLSVLTFATAKKIPATSLEVLRIYFPLFRQQILNLELLTSLSPCMAKLVCSDRVNAFLQIHPELFSLLVSGEIKPDEIDTKNFHFWGNILKLKMSSMAATELKSYAVMIAAKYTFSPVELIDLMIHLQFANMKQILQGHGFYQTLFIRPVSSTINLTSADRLPEFVAIAEDFLQQRRPQKQHRTASNRLFTPPENDIALQVCKTILTLAKIRIRPVSRLVSEEHEATPSLASRKRK